MPLKWITNACLDSPREYAERLNLEIECVRRDPKPSDTMSVEELKAQGFYGLYKEVP